MYVKPGACIKQGRHLSCAFDTDDCNHLGAQFISSQIISEGDPNAAEAICLDAGTGKIEVPIGRCTSTVDDQFCSSTESGCAIPTLFSPRDSNCNVLGDIKLGGMSNTYFGSCSTSNFDFCAWSVNDCPGHKWRSAQDVSFHTDSYCQCKDVHVGACKPPADSRGTKSPYCAVSINACDIGDRWVSAIELQQTAEFECMLCEPDLENYVSSGVADLSDNIGAEETIGASKNLAGLSNGALAGIIVAGCLGAVVLALIPLFNIRCTKGNKTISTRGLQIV